MAPGPALYFYNHGNFQDHTHEKAKLRQKKGKDWEWNMVWNNERLNPWWKFGDSFISILSRGWLTSGLATSGFIGELFDLPMILTADSDKQWFSQPHFDML